MSLRSKLALSAAQAPSFATVSAVGAFAPAGAMSYVTTSVSAVSGFANVAPGQTPRGDYYMTLVAELCQQQGCHSGEFARFTLQTKPDADSFRIWCAHCLESTDVPHWRAIAWFYDYADAGVCMCTQSVPLLAEDEAERTRKLQEELGLLDITQLLEAEQAPKEEEHG